MSFEQLRLNNQFCFPVYALSRLITREYQPYLEKLNITYPQYLALMVLWEHNGITVNEISHKLILNTNTVTPLLKRMETMGLLERKRSDQDERKVIIRLTPKGKELEKEAAQIPLQLIQNLAAEDIPLESLAELKKQLYTLIDYLHRKAPEAE